MVRNRTFQVLVLVISLFSPMLFPNLANASGTGTTTMTLIVQSGSGTLSISTPVSINLGTAYAPSTVLVDIGTVIVSDTRGGGLGWTTSAIATALTPASGPTIAASAIGYKSGIITTVGSATLVETDQTNLTGQVTVVTASLPTGTYSATWTPWVSVVIPTGLAAGTYTGSITHSVA